MADVLSDRDLALVDAYWRAANYVSVGQIYLLDNPLLREPLQLRHVKPRLLGHWGTTPGLNFVYVHLNRVIRKFDLDTLYVCGPGHGGPAMVANTYLEGTYTEVYPHVTQDADGLRRLFRQFSFPAAFRATWRPRRPDRFTRGASSATRSPTPTAPRSTTRPPGGVRDRRRRGGDGTAGHGVALEQVPRPEERRRGPSDPPPERLQDLESDGPGADQRSELESLLTGYGYRPNIVEARAAPDASGDARPRSKASSRRSGRSRRPRGPAASRSARAGRGTGPP